MEERDQRRWNLADLDNDGELNREEFKAFLHPEDQDHMRDIVVTETLEDIDKDGDGSINVDEYIGDMYRDDESEGAEGKIIIAVDRYNVLTWQSLTGSPQRESSSASSETGMAMESWTWRRFDNFNTLSHLYLHLNYQVKAWIIPPDYDHSEAEAKHLLFEADIDHDNLLTKDEILEKYDIFVGSQVTVYKFPEVWKLIFNSHLKATDFGEALTRHDEF